MPLVFLITGKYHGGEKCLSPSWADAQTSVDMKGKQRPNYLYTYAGYVRFHTNSIYTDYKVMFRSKGVSFIFSI